MAKEYKITSLRLADLEKELNYLKTTREREVAAMIAEARSYGDLSENSEYDAAKNEQAKLYGRIAEIEDVLSHATIIEDENEYKVEVAAPGMTKEDFKVHINEDNELIVTMEKKAEQKEEDKKKGTYLRREFSYTKFQQSLLLPDNVVREKIAAKVENGVMTIEIPKKKETEAAVAARQIEVR